MGKKILGTLIIALSALCMAGVFSSSEAGVIYVDKDGTASESWGTPNTDLQTAINAAVSGDEIWVKQGTYTPGTSRTADSFELKDGVAIYGGFTGSETERTQRNWRTNVTILSGEIGDDEDDTNNIQHVVKGNGTDDTAVLDGFTITKGYDDSGTGGGGMMNSNGSPTVRNCTFKENTTSTNGGGMYNYSGSPQIESCTFESNTASIGGGMYNRSGSPEVSKCIFTQNTATSSGGSSGGVGGGVANDNSDPKLTDCTFTENTAKNNGGGIFNTDSSPQLLNCFLGGNIADVKGGGMYTYSASNVSRPVLTNCVFSGNSAVKEGTETGDGGGMCNLGSTPTLINCTFSGNTTDGNGGAMANYTNSRPFIYNSIFWGNTATSEISLHVDDSTPTVEYCLVQGGYAGTSVLNVDPNFVDPDGADDTVGTADDDLRLSVGSLAIDAGNNDEADSVTTDFEGNPRFSGSGDTPNVDMGAYEYQPKPPTITSFSLASGGTGTEVVITGTNFTDGATVQFGVTDAASFTVDSDIQLTAKVGEGTTGKITVTTPDGTAESTEDFTYIPPPEITSFDPTSGSTGTEVTITGTNLSGATVVQFGDTDAANPPTVVSDTQITAVVGSGATGNIAVTTLGGTAKSTQDFTYVLMPTITGIDPPSAGSGTSVIITGTNFTSVTAVKFGDIEAQIISINESGTQITVTPGDDSKGSVTVTTPEDTVTGGDDISFSFVRMGDIYFDGSIDLRDAIVCLMISSATQLAPAISNGIHLGGDTDGGKKIGVEDAVYILVEISK